MGTVNRSNCAVALVASHELLFYASCLASRQVVEHSFVHELILVRPVNVWIQCHSNSSVNCDDKTTNN